ncbi:histidinol dehydrogenase [Vineibacter terrae]|uniref:Histidinol dehydrogenase n=1 Tax=Vineibacter terrae TaxID=2586908 RepID=A0A5C8PRK9_9HYPH|nr:histidinol dehydrogenase [Vineibacter terrae]TXL77671.1 histidinol dehydrogenase [Vineibacter terrae]
MSVDSDGPLRLDARAPDFETAFAAFLARDRDSGADVDAVARDIVADVRRRGDAAVIEYTTRFDRIAVTPGTLRLSAAEIDAAASAAAPEARAAIEFAASRIEAYHRRLLPTDLDFVDAQGVRLGARFTALDAVGLYVPGGKAAYPSSLLMNAIPAKVAGVRRIAMVMPTPGGALDPLVMCAARVAGIDEIYRIGGAQAVAALAYGTATIAPVDKIVGPGNAYVAAAKRLVFGKVGIDLIAGPSEILVVADAANDPSWIAADLLSQAEHDEAAQSILICDDAAFADAVCRAVTGELKRLDTAERAAKSWQGNGAVILVPSLLDAAPIIDRIAAEHVELCLEPGPAETLMRRIRHAGAIFLGRHTPEAVGDYVAGTNHVLPTSRTARFSSGLGVADFLKRTSIVSCDAEALARIGPAAVTLAAAEGLPAHGRSVSIRTNRA